MQMVTIQRLNPCSNGICSLTSLCMTQRSPLGSLNPCSNGICSLTYLWWFRKGSRLWSLNPCSNGICSLTGRTVNTLGRRVVLILVLMEYALWQKQYTSVYCFYFVLILVLMEYALWQHVQGESGVWRNVLILVLMEYALWPYHPFSNPSLRARS